MAIQNTPHPSQGTISSTASSAGKNDKTSSTAPEEVSRKATLPDTQEEENESYEAPLSTNKEWK